MRIADPSIAREIESLRRTLRTLRGEHGCPWDREQELDDIISYLIEEAYELLHAEKTKDWAEVEEELGDVIFIVVFIHELILEERSTPLSAIVARAHRKIVRRHPHVFGSTKARTSAESIAEWERIKLAERKASAAGRSGGRGAGTGAAARRTGRGKAPGLLDGVPEKLPPARRAAAVQRLAASVGFDWPDESGILDKLDEEIAELRAALKRGRRSRVKGELGDLLFTVVNLARRLGIDAEASLEGTTERFVSRFASMERSARRSRRELASLTLEQQERLWQKAKKGGARKRPRA